MNYKDGDILIPGINKSMILVSLYLENLKDRL